jgi:hypothetical protein
MMQKAVTSNAERISAQKPEMSNHQMVNYSPVWSSAKKMLKFSLSSAINKNNDGILDKKYLRDRAMAYETQELRCLLYA